MKFATIIPQFGYGWQRDGQTIDVPSSFRIEVKRYEKDNTADGYKLVAGRVSEPGHALDGFWLSTSLRTTGPNPSYNIYFYREEPPFMTKGDIDPFCISRTITGFGTLVIS